MNAILSEQPDTAAIPAPRVFDTDTAKWEAVYRRDRAADGQFLYSVQTTGVYCRPSCAARVPRRENVAFHLTATEAEQAGFRPCKRCQPDLPARSEREAALVAEACRAIESAGNPLPLTELAARARVSPHHFHRLFKRIVGVTPKAYAAAQRQNRVQENLCSGAGVTEAMYAAGFNSSARFYESAPGLLGMTPSAYRNGGEGEAVRSAVRACSLGYVLVAATGRGLCAILLGSDPAALQGELEARFPKARLSAPEPPFDAWVEQVVRLVDDPARKQGLGLPLDIQGTAFQRRVWEALRQIPPGRTATYAEVAESLGSPNLVRAVAGACAANPLAVAIPCHRVIASSGKMAGYRWGVERKQWLLDRERS